MRRLFLLIYSFYFLGLVLSSHLGYSQCNGDIALCDKRYDHVVYVTTHNAFNYSPSFSFPNQSFPVSQQLLDGVRAFMLDVYDVLGTPTLYHGTLILGSEPLEDVLIDIKDFLQANPNEVLTIIFEANVTASAMESVFTSAGLNSYLHTQPLGQTWPTLQQLIDMDERLIVFSDVDDAGPGQEWYHYMWDYCVETDYANNSQADFSCDFNRGDSINSLFILNHFITNGLTGTGELDSSVIANSNPYFINRANQCMAEKGKLPNFLTVDFYDVGDVFDTKNQLNDAYVGVENLSTHKSQISIFPNPAAGIVSIVIDKTAWSGAVLTIFDESGKKIRSFRTRDWSDGTLMLSTDGLGKGLFFIKLEQPGNLNTVEKIVIW